MRGLNNRPPGQVIFLPHGAKSLHATTAKRNKRIWPQAIMEESNLASPVQQQFPSTIDDAEITHTYFSSTQPGSPADDSDNSQLLIGESLIPVRERKHAGTTIVTIDGLLKEPLQLKEDLKEGCGGQVWPAGLLLSRYMLEEHATDLVGKTMFVHPPSDTEVDSITCALWHIYRNCSDD